MSKEGREEKDEGRKGRRVNIGKVEGKRRERGQGRGVEGGGEGGQMRRRYNVTNVTHLIKGQTELRILLGPCQYVLPIGVMHG